MQVRMQSSSASAFQESNRILKLSQLKHRQICLDDMLSKENQSASFAFCENNTTQYTWGRSACEDCCFAIDQLTARCPSPWWHTADLSKLDNDLFRCCPKKTCKWKFRSPHPSLRCWLPKETEIRLRDSAEDTTCLTMEFGNVDQAAIMWRETKPWTIGRFEAAVVCIIHQKWGHRSGTYCIPRWWSIHISRGCSAPNIPRASPEIIIS